MDEFIAPVNPFPGIRSYEPHEDMLFFGREKQIAELTERLTETRFIAVIGSSGCGKSSLIKAGLIPSLFKGKLSGTAGKWRLTTFRPGEDPMLSLAAALLPPDQAGDAGKEGSAAGLALKEKFLADQSSLAASMAATGAGESHLVYIDQFEELFRFKRSASDPSQHQEAGVFVDLLLEVARQREVPVHIVLSMRSDFLDNCTEYRGLTEAINKGYYLVPRMIRQEIRSVITGPVGVMQGKIEDSLVERLLDEVGDDPDQLPILQHALMRTWDHWKMNRLTDEGIDHRHYEAIGTMTEALSFHAEEVFSEMTGPRSKYLVERLFKSLIAFAEQSRGTRRPTQVSEICLIAGSTLPEMTYVIDRFREPGRAFLMPPARVDLEEDTIIDISHESLMRVWSRLKEWYEEELQSAQLYLRLSHSARLYQEGKAGLWVDPELQLAVRWYEQSRPNATWAIRYEPAYERAIQFLEYSRHAYEQEILLKERLQQRNLQRTKRFSIILGSASVISILLLILALNMMFKSEANEKKALEKEQVAVSQSRTAAEQTQQALIQKKISEQQQQIAEQQRLITEEQKEYAVRQQQIAVSQTAEAIRQKQLANASRVQALQSRDEAEAQRKEAVSQKQIADQERNKAATSEQQAQRLRRIAIARSLAIQSSRLQPSAEGDLPFLLAREAYEMISENQGNVNDPDIFSALSRVADDKPVLRKHNDEVRGLSLSPAANALAACSSDGTISIWNTADLTATPAILTVTKRPGAGFRCLSYSPDGKILAAGNGNGEIHIWPTLPLKQNPVMVFSAHTAPVTCLAFLNGSGMLLSSSGNGELTLWDLEQEKPVRRNLFNPGMKIGCFVASEKGDLVFAGLSDGSVFRIRPGAPAEEKKKLYQAVKGVESMALISNGTLLAAGLSNGMILLIDPEHPERDPVSLIGHLSAVSSLTFSPDGALLLSSGYDRTIRLWNFLEPAEPPRLITDHDGWVMDAAFARQGDRIVSCGADKTIRLFLIDPGVLAGNACLRVSRNLTREEWSKYIGKDIPYRATCKPQ